MAKHIKDSYLLTADEYNALIDPDTRYSLMTVTAAKKAVTNLLKATNSTCWNDDPDILSDDWCCSMCPVHRMLGDDAGGRICTRPKAWSK